MSNNEVERKDILIIQDCEPDDYLAMMMLNKYVPEKVNFYILVVSPNPEKHVEDTRGLFDSMKSKRKVTIWQGASYSSKNGFVEPKDQSYVKEFKELFENVSDDSLDVMLLTTCYGLVNHLEGSKYVKKIKHVWHMGGGGVSKIVKNGVEDPNWGFNWRIGLVWANLFMKRIPFEKCTLLEPAFYVPEFLKTFDGTVSICPTTFPKFIEKLFNSDLPIAKEFIKHNKIWVEKTLGKNQDLKKFYKEGEEEKYIGPADILLVFCYLTNGHFDIVNETKVVSRNLFGDSYQVTSICSIDWDGLEHVLIGVLD